MSAIDQYKHRVIGFIECPSTHDFVYNSKTRQIAVYELLENIPGDESSFNGKRGDILVGGGRGEAPALRIAIPEAFHYFASEDWDGFSTYEELFKAYWTPTQSYILCEGFTKLSWTPDTNIEQWLAENVCKALADTTHNYSIFKSGMSENTTALTFIKPE